MGMYLEFTPAELLLPLILILWFVYWYLSKNYNYWNERGIPYKNAEFPFGSLKDLVLMKTFTGKAHDNIYKEFLKERFYGIIDFRSPALVVKDPELIKLIMVKDFHYFADRPILMGNPKEYLMLHLLNLIGQEWKDMRAKLTPTFTSGKMKLMYSLMEQCSSQLQEQLEVEIKNGKIIDAKNILARFTLDIIASCAFGIESQSLTKENADFFRRFGRVAKTTKARYLRRLFGLFFPSVIKLFRLNFIKPDLRDFITNIVRETIDYRKKNNIKRNDFIDLLMNIKQNLDECRGNDNSNSEYKSISANGLTIEQMAAQTFVFIVAGFETASSLMSFCLYELSCHQDIQEKLYQDIEEAVARNGGKMSYQVLMEMPFLDQVINETLRLYGSANVLSRMCTRPYKIPGTDFVVEKGIRVIIPLYSLHHDQQYYPDPYAFKPERFAPEETKNRHPYVFMPFGEGPRNCIGMRFGLMQARLGLATVMLNFQVDLSPEQEVPIEIDKLSIALQPANPVLLKFTKRVTG